MKKLNAIGLAAILTVAIAAVAFAYDGDDSPMGGYGGHMMGYDGYCGPYMHGRRGWGDLSDKDATKLNASRDKFYNDTRELRSKLDEKRDELRDAINQNNPDRAKVFELQKQVSSLQGEFDQKALAHRLEMRKLLPENYRASGDADGYCR